MPQLSPCPNCQRHIRVSETKCPFCLSPIEIKSYTEKSGYLRDQIAIAFIGATLAVSGCNTRVEQNKTPLNPTENTTKQTAPSTEATSKPESALPVSQPIPPEPEIKAPAPAYGGTPAPMYGLPPKPYSPKPMYGKPPKP